MKAVRQVPAALCVVLLAACGGGGGGAAPAATGLVIAPAGSAVAGDQVTPLTALAASIGTQAPDQEPVAVNVASETDPLNPATGASVGSSLADAEPVPVTAFPASALDPEKPRG
ncbi:MAG: hypothetical protein KGI67_10485 [Pseudomonadota bacterium]|nr:hypothetical protein [Pseudomonadota bacterium]